MHKNLYCEKCYKELYGKTKQEVYEVSYEKFICSKCGKKRQVIVNVRKNYGVIDNQ